MEDVEAAYGKARDSGLPIELTLGDEDFGRRQFMTCDPTGVLIDAIKPIPPSDDFYQFAKMLTHPLIEVIADFSCASMA